MKGLECGKSLFTKLQITEEKINNQISEFAKKSKEKNVQEMFEYKLYYYPFYVMRIKGELKRNIFNDLYKQIFICLDAVKGYYAVANVMSGDSYFDQDISDKLALGAVAFQPLIGTEEALKIGIENLRRSNAFSFRSSFWLNNKVKIIPSECKLIYKPFWRVKINNAKGEFIRVIDGTTGEVGGSNGYRFLQGYDKIITRRSLENV